MQGLIIAVVILVVLGSVLWLTQRWQKSNETALAQLAQSEGWQYQKSYELSQLGSGNVLLETGTAGEVRWTDCRHTQLATDRGTWRRVENSLV